MRSPVTPNQLSAAYHESGHAVIAAVEGIEVLAVSIDVHIDDSVDGLCRTWRTIFSPSELQLPEAERQKLKLEKRCRMILAGGSAVLRLREVSNEFGLSPGDDGDQQEALEVAGQLALLAGRTRSSVISSLQAEADEAVKRYWCEIDALAQELLWQRHMPRPRLRRVIFTDADWNERWSAVLGPKKANPKSGSVERRWQWF
jgi:hypothetical protein